MIKFNEKGDFRKLDRFFERALEVVKFGELDKYGRMGVDALSQATPVDTGRCAQSWRYEIHRGKGWTKLEWHNDDIEGGANVALLLQYGHGTKNGRYVQGIDYINPAISPIFKLIKDKVLKEVENA